MINVLPDWDDAFNNCEPIAHLLRSHLPERWVRFHCLPESKRYPENESEYLTILARHNAVLERLVAGNANIVLLTTEFSFSPRPSKTPMESPDAKWWRTAAVDEERFLHVYATAMNWRSGIADSIFRKVADDQIGNVMICQADCAWLHHAYDGGMDIIMRTTPERYALRDNFRSWLSALPSGL